MRNPILGVRNLILGVWTRSDTNQSAQSQKKARRLKYWKQVEEELYYLCKENKVADQLQLQLTCAFVLAYTKVWFPHDAAHYVM